MTFALSNVLGSVAGSVLGSIPEPVVTLGQESLRRYLLGENNSLNSKSTDSLFMFIVWICILSFVPMMVAMVYFVMKYRRKPGVPTQRSVSHNTPIELAWSVGPLLILVVVFFWGFHGYMNKIVAPSDAEEIVIRGYKWGWDIRYSNGAQPSDLRQTGVGANTEVPVIKVPAGRPIKLRIYSTDVIHSFYVPAFRTKIDAIPNRYTSFWFTAENETWLLDENGKEVYDQDGERIAQPHVVYCAEYCGDNHSEMMAWIQVVSHREFEAEKNFVPQADNILQEGEYLFKRNCASCHSLDGSPNTGPSWKGTWGKTDHAVTIDGRPATVVVDADYLRESILVPQAKLTAGYANAMNSFQGLLNAEQIDALIAYFKAQSEVGRAELRLDATLAEELDNPDGVFWHGR